MRGGTRASKARIGGWAGGWEWYVAVAALIFATSLFGIEMTGGSSRIATIWISNAILLAILLKSLVAQRPQYELLALLAMGFAGNLAANSLTGDPLPASAALALCNIAEIVICAGALVLSRLPIDFTRPKFLMLFCLIALGPAPVLSGLLAAGFLTLTQNNSFFEVFSIWYAADALGLIIITPILMVVRGRDVVDIFQVSRIKRLAAVVVMMLAVLLFVFLQSSFPLLFLVLPAILVATFWLGFPGASLATLLTALVAGIATVHGYGPLGLIPDGPRAAIFVFQVFLAVAALQNLTVAAVLLERKKLETALRDAKIAAEWSEAELEVSKRGAERAASRAEKASEAKTEFLASMSHEMRTPLNAILGFTSIVLDDGGLPPQAERKISLAQNAAQSLLAVVNDVLDFSKIEAGQIDIDSRPFSPVAQVDSVVSIVRTIAETKGLSMTLHVDEAVPEWLIGDDLRINQVLLNLLNNAIKFTEHGVVALKIVHHGSTQAGDEIGFYVTDTGIGIAKSNQERLFKRFSQVDSGIQRRYGGTGLGLAISKRLVGLLGGTLCVESDEGKGSTFWFKLTLPRTEAPEIDAVQSERREVPRPLRILLVEDLPMNQEIAETMLSRAGHGVDMAGDGVRAIAAVEAGTYDLILMDIQMPNMDGVTATQHIRNLGGQAARVPIVAMTANVLPDQIQRFKSAGLNDHLGKPFNKHQLLAMVAKWSPRRPQGPEMSAATDPMDAGDFNQMAFDQLKQIFDEAKLQKYLGALQALLSELTEDDADRTALAEKAHKLRSMAGMLGFMRISVLLGELEQTCEDAGDVEASLASLREAEVAAAERMTALRAA